MTTQGDPINSQREMGSDQLLDKQGILGEVHHRMEVVIAEDMEEDRLTQNAPELDDKNAQQGA